MAGKSFVVAHDHCKVCGACFLSPAQLHKCPEPVDLEVLAVFLAESRREQYKPTSVHKD